MISMILFMLAAFCWGIMNVLQWHHSTSVFALQIPIGFWGSQSWKRKYRLTQFGQPEYIERRHRNLYYKTFRLQYRERFPLSATALVWLTDGYHFLQFIMISLLCAALTLWNHDVVSRGLAWILIHFFVFRGLWWLGFNLAYNLFQKR